MILFFGIYLFKARSEMNNMSPLETKEVISNIFSMNDSFVNMYLLKDSTQYIAIDAGNDASTILKELKKINIDPDRILAVLLTHSDADHVAAISAFNNAKIYLSRPEVQLIDGSKSRFFIFGNHLSAREYSTIDDQQVFKIGNFKIEGFLTPGHTPGSMCYLINDKYLFTGDAFSLKSGKIERFNEFFNMDTQTAIRSMEKITQIPEAEYIFTAHHGYIGYKQAIFDWKKR